MYWRNKVWVSIVHITDQIYFLISLTVLWWFNVLKEKVLMDSHPFTLLLAIMASVFVVVLGCGGKGPPSHTTLTPSLPPRRAWGPLAAASTACVFPATLLSTPYLPWLLQVQKVTVELIYQIICYLKAQVWGLLVRDKSWTALQKMYKKCPKNEEFEFHLYSGILELKCPLSQTTWNWNFFGRMLWCGVCLQSWFLVLVVKALLAQSLLVWLVLSPLFLVVFGSQEESWGKEEWEEDCKSANWSDKRTSK